MRVWLWIFAVATAVTTGAGCSNGGNTSSSRSLADSGADRASTDDSTADSGATDVAPLSADCQRLYDCCVGPAAQTPKFCVGLVAQNICGVWLQSYAMAGIQCP
jgi:hypothetical protein